MHEVTKPQIIITLFLPIFNIDSLPNYTIGQKIYKYRKANNLYQKDLADMIGVSLTTIANYENERTIPLKNTLNKLKYYEIIWLLKSEVLKCRYKLKFQWLNRNLILKFMPFFLLLKKWNEKWNFKTLINIEKRMVAKDSQYPNLQP